MARRDMKGAWSVKKGIMEWYDRNRGYGFIAGGSREENIFVHFSGLYDKGATPPAAGDTVTYDVVPSRNGRKAVNVRIVHQPTPGSHHDHNTGGDRND